MKKITFEELPDWFQLKNYDAARQFNPSDWFLQLEHRSWMVNVVERAQEWDDSENKNRFMNFYNQIKNTGMCQMKVLMVEAIIILKNLLLVKR